MPQSLALDELEQLFLDFPEIQKSQPIKSYLSSHPSATEPFKPGSVIQRAIDLLKEGSDEVMLTRMTIETKKEYISRLDQIRLIFLASVVLQDGSQFFNHFKPREKADQVRMIGHLVKETGGSSKEALDRKRFVTDTNELMGSLEESEFPDYARNVMRLKLEGLISVASVASGYSDSDVRFRVKGVVADFLSQYEKLEVESSSLREKVVAWAKKYSRDGMWALALTADVTAVAGLLPGPK